MKKILPVAMAALLAVSFTAFSAFRPVEKKATLHYKIGSNWYTYTGNQCPDGIDEACLVNNPQPGQSGTVYLYTDRIDSEDYLAKRPFQ